MSMSQEQTILMLDSDSELSSCESNAAFISTTETEDMATAEDNVVEQTVPMTPMSTLLDCAQSGVNQILKPIKRCMVTYQENNMEKQKYPEIFHLPYGIMEKHYSNLKLGVVTSPITNSHLNFMRQFLNSDYNYVLQMRMTQIDDIVFFNTLINKVIKSSPYFIYCVRGQFTLYTAKDEETIFKDSIIKVDRDRITDINGEGILLIFSNVQIVGKDNSKNIRTTQVDLRWTNDIKVTVRFGICDGFDLTEPFWMKDFTDLKMTQNFQLNVVNSVEFFFNFFFPDINLRDQFLMFYQGFDKIPIQDALVELYMSNTKGKFLTDNTMYYLFRRAQLPEKQIKKLLKMVEKIAFGNVKTIGQHIEPLQMGDIKIYLLDKWTPGYTNYRVEESICVNLLYDSNKERLKINTLIQLYVIETEQDICVIKQLNSENKIVEILNNNGKILDYGVIQLENINTDEIMPGDLVVVMDNNLSHFMTMISTISKNVRLLADNFLKITELNKYLKKQVMVEKLSKYKRVVLTQGTVDVSEVHTLMNLCNVFKFKIVTYDMNPHSVEVDKSVYFWEVPSNKMAVLDEQGKLVGVVDEKNYRITWFGVEYKINVDHTQSCVAALLFRKPGEIENPNDLPPNCKRTNAGIFFFDINEAQKYFIDAGRDTVVSYPIENIFSYSKTYTLERYRLARVSETANRICSSITLGYDEMRNVKITNFIRSKKYSNIPTIEFGVYTTNNFLVQIAMLEKEINNRILNINTNVAILDETNFLKQWLTVAGVRTVFLKPTKEDQERDILIRKTKADYWRIKTFPYLIIGMLISLLLMILLLVMHFVFRDKGDFQIVHRTKRSIIDFDNKTDTHPLIFNLPKWFMIATYVIEITSIGSLFFLINFCKRKLIGVFILFFSSISMGFSTSAVIMQYLDISNSNNIIMAFYIASVALQIVSMSFSAFDTAIFLIPILISYVTNVFLISVLYNGYFAWTYFTLLVLLVMIIFTTGIRVGIRRFASTDYTTTSVTNKEGKVIKRKQHFDDGAVQNEWNTQQKNLQKKRYNDRLPVNEVQPQSCDFLCLIPQPSDDIVSKSFKNIFHKMYGLSDISNSGVIILSHEKQIGMDTGMPVAQCFVLDHPEYKRILCFNTHVKKRAFESNKIIRFYFPMLNEEYVVHPSSKNIVTFQDFSYLSLNDEKLTQAKGYKMETDLADKFRIMIFFNFKHYNRLDPDCFVLSAYPVTMDFEGRVHAPTFPGQSGSVYLSPNGKAVSMHSSGHEKQLVNYSMILSKLGHDEKMSPFLDSSEWQDFELASVLPHQVMEKIFKNLDLPIFPLITARGSKIDDYVYKCSKILEEVLKIHFNTSWTEYYKYIKILIAALRMECQGTNIYQMLMSLVDVNQRMVSVDTVFKGIEIPEDELFEVAKFLLNPINMHFSLISTNNIGFIPEFIATMLYGQGKKIEEIREILQKEWTGTNAVITKHCKKTIFKKNSTLKDVMEVAFELAHDIVDLDVDSYYVRTVNRVVQDFFENYYELSYKMTNRTLRNNFLYNLSLHSYGKSNMILHEMMNSKIPEIEFLLESTKVKKILTKFDNFENELVKFLKERNLEYERLNLGYYEKLIFFSNDLKFIEKDDLEKYNKRLFLNSLSKYKIFETFWEDQKIKPKEQDVKLILSFKVFFKMFNNNLPLDSVNFEDLKINDKLIDVTLQRLVFQKIKTSETKPQTLSRTFLFDNPNKRLEQYLTSEEVAEKLIELLEIKTTDSVIDLGTGTGRLLHGYQAAEKIGIDIDYEALQKAAVLNPDARFCNGDITENHVITKKYDVVVSNPPWGGYNTNNNIEKIFLNRAFLLSRKKIGLIISPITYKYLKTLLKDNYWIMTKSVQMQQDLPKMYVDHRQDNKTTTCFVVVLENNLVNKVDSVFVNDRYVFGQNVLDKEIETKLTNNVQDLEKLRQIKYQNFFGKPLDREMDKITAQFLDLNVEPKVQPQMDSDYLKEEAIADFKRFMNRDPTEEEWKSFGQDFIEKVKNNKRIQPNFVRTLGTVVHMDSDYPQMTFNENREEAIADFIRFRGREPTDEDWMSMAKPQDFQLPLDLTKFIFKQKGKEYLEDLININQEWLNIQREGQGSGLREIQLPEDMKISPEYQKRIIQSNQKINNRQLNHQAYMMSQKKKALSAEMRDNENMMLNSTRTALVEKIKQNQRDQNMKQTLLNG